MSKTPHIMLFCVLAKVTTYQGGIKCIECSSVSSDGDKIMEVCFEYYDYKTLMNNDYHIELCVGCFKRKIYSKTLDKLFTYIPLLKIRQREMVIEELPFYPRLLNPLSTIDISKYIYTRIQTKEISKEFILQAKNQFNPR